jgi:UDP-N-acetylmuramate dehydrogenase
LADLVATGILQTDHPIAPMTTYKFGGLAAWYGEADSIDTLKVMVAARNEEKEPPPLFVLGRGSNVVIADSGFDGVVVRLTGAFNEITWQGSVVAAGAAVSLPRLARACAAVERGGLEFFVGIPGSVGGAIVMNAGGHGADTATWLVDAAILDIASGETTVENSTSLALGYRHSRLGPGDVVLYARFRTVPRSRSEGEQLMREITGWRRQHQPGGTFNAGSVFKNPPGDAAGRLIDQAGLKGYRCGSVSVSERHANFFVADSDAVAEDVFRLVADVRRLVMERFGVELEPEIRFIGDFSVAQDD